MRPKKFKNLFLPISVLCKVLAIAINCFLLFDFSGLVFLCAAMSSKPTGKGRKIAADGQTKNCRHHSNRDLGN